MKQWIKISLFNKKQYLSGKKKIRAEGFTWKKKKKIPEQAASEKKNSCEVKIPHPPPPSPHHFSNGPLISKAFIALNVFIPKFNYFIISVFFFFLWFPWKYWHFCLSLIATDRSWRVIFYSILKKKKEKKKRSLDVSAKGELIKD